MNLLEKAKSMLAKNKTAAEGGVEKAGDAVDDRTAGKYTGQVDTAQNKADDYLERNDEQGSSGQATPSG